MATQKQIEANRRNALKSTGPKTPEGKKVVSLNSLRHGLRAHQVVLPGENPEAFLQLCDDLQAEWQPLTRTEQFYVEQMAVAHWKLRRMEVAEASIHSKPAAPAIQIPLLDRMWQAQSRMERSYSRAQHELERIQIARAQQAQQPSLQNDEPAPAVSTPALIPTTPTSTISETVGQDFILQPAFSRPAPNHHLPSAP